MMKCDIKKTCPNCNGEGIHYGNAGDLTKKVTDPCPTCNGDKEIVTGYVDLTELETQIADVLDKCNDIMDKCNDILEKVGE